MPFFSASSLYSPPSASSISESDGAMCVLVRWTMVTSAPFSHSAAQMSCAELLEPSTTAFLPLYCSGPVCLLEWCWSPSKVSAPAILGTLA